MQTKEDEKIQNNLDSAGKGLPVIEALFLRHIGFPLMKTIVSWDRGMKFFEYEGEKILNAVKELDDATLFKRVLIPRVAGIEDNSRYYSPRITSVIAASSQ